MAAPGVKARHPNSPSGQQRCGIAVMDVLAKTVLLGLASGLLLHGSAAAAVTPYDKVYAHAFDVCREADATDQTRINQCSWDSAQELQAYEALVIQAARDSVLRDNGADYEPYQLKDFAAEFDKGVQEWRRAVDLECHAAGIAMNGTGAGQVISNCMFRRADEHIRGLIEDYNLEKQFGPLPARK
jgi:hypothetical protein